MNPEQFDALLQTLRSIDNSLSAIRANSKILAHWAEDNWSSLSNQPQNLPGFGEPVPPHEPGVTQTQLSTSHL